jgi:ArsR family transcriptional regulator
MTDYEAQAKLYKALTHPVRLAILDILRFDEECVCHMEAILGLRQAYVSQQLMVLREAGLIQERRDGWNIFYRVVEPRIYTVLDAMSALIGVRPEPTLLDHGVRTRSDACPCPKCNPVAETVTG